MEYINITLKEFNWEYVIMPLNVFMILYVPLKNDVIIDDDGTLVLNNKKTKINIINYIFNLKTSNVVLEDMVFFNLVETFTQFLQNDKR